MTILTICEAALREIGGVEVPASYTGSNNKTAVQCLALLNREGQSLEREYRWSELISTHTFTTVSGTASYSLPTDFRAFGNMSQWDRTNQLKMVGPTAPSVWQWLQSGITSSGAAINRWFSVRGGLFYIYPTPTVTGDTIAFDYYSKNWLTLQSGGTGTTIASDNDTPRLDDAIITMGLKWRFLQAKGFPFEAEYREYETIKTEMLADNAGKGTICLGKPRIVLTNLPDTGYGQ